ncbi:Pectinacetylesterase family protein [Prunus dulcis]|uniref:Pectin acetylesterase n=1 Tax=Prunus dulcis TaxID=3755 RepID=A0A4Y1RF91_PRUDU|nr:Pectinacetylesterase family protein [Prunus dulcis]
MGHRFWDHKESLLPSRFGNRQMADARLGQWLFLLACAVTLLKAAGVPVEITYVHSAIAKGADKREKKRRYSNNNFQSVLVIQKDLLGGGWCNNVTNCLGRKNTRLGSSKQMLKAIAFSGILSNRKMFNPDFYNWNRIKVRYCDGASFTGDVAAATGLYFRGARIFRAVIEDLLAKGMGNAQNGSARNLPPSCTSKLRPVLLPAIYGIPNPDADILCKRSLRFMAECKISAGISLVLHLTVSPSIHADQEHFGTGSCRSSWHLARVQARYKELLTHSTQSHARVQFLSAIGGMTGCPLKGMFIDSCYAHCQTEMQETWLMADSPVLNKTTIAQAVGDWFYGRTPFQKIDCPYPCNPSCHNRVFDPNQHLIEQ